MAERFTDRHGHHWLKLTRHGNGKRVLVRAQAITAIAEGVPGRDEHNAALHIGEAHPLRVTDTFDGIADELISGWAVK